MNFSVEKKVRNKRSSLILSRDQILKLKQKYSLSQENSLSSQNSDLRAQSETQNILKADFVTNITVNDTEKDSDNLQLDRNSLLKLKSQFKNSSKSSNDEETATNESNLAENNSKNGSNSTKNSNLDKWLDGIVSEHSEDFDYSTTTSKLQLDRESLLNLKNKLYIKQETGTPSSVTEKDKYNIDISYLQKDPIIKITSGSPTTNEHLLFEDGFLIKSRPVLVRDQHKDHQTPELDSYGSSTENYIHKDSLSPSSESEYNAINLREKFFENQKLIFAQKKTESTTEFKTPDLPIESNGNSASNTHLLDREHLLNLKEKFSEHQQATEMSSSESLVYDENYVTLQNFNDIFDEDHVMFEFSNNTVDKDHSVSEKFDENNDFATSTSTFDSTIDSLIKLIESNVSSNNQELYLKPVKQFDQSFIDSTTSDDFVSHNTENKYSETDTKSPNHDEFVESSTIKPGYIGSNKTEIDDDGTNTSTTIQGDLGAMDSNDANKKNNMNINANGETEFMSTDFDHIDLVNSTYEIATGNSSSNDWSGSLDNSDGETTIIDTNNNATITKSDASSMEVSQSGFSIMGADIGQTITSIGETIIMATSHDEPSTVETPYDESNTVGTNVSGAIILKSNSTDENNSFELMHEGTTFSVAGNEESHATETIDSGISLLEEPIKTSSPSSIISSSTSVLPGSDLFVDNNETIQDLMNHLQQLNANLNDNYNSSPDDDPEHLYHGTSSTPLESVSSISSSIVAKDEIKMSTLPPHVNQENLLNLTPIFLENQVDNSTKNETKHLNGIAPSYGQSYTNQILQSTTSNKTEFSVNHEVSTSTEPLNTIGSGNLADYFEYLSSSNPLMFDNENIKIQTHRPFVSSTSPQVLMGDGDNTHQQSASGNSESASNSAVYLGPSESSSELPLPSKYKHVLISSQAMPPVPSSDLSSYLNYFTESPEDVDGPLDLSTYLTSDGSDLLEYEAFSNLQQNQESLLELKNQFINNKLQANKTKWQNIKQSTTETSGYNQGEAPNQTIASFVNSVAHFDGLTTENPYSSSIVLQETSELAIHYQDQENLSVPIGVTSNFMQGFHNQYGTTPEDDTKLDEPYSSIKLNQEFLNELKEEATKDKTLGNSFISTNVTENAISSESFNLDSVLDEYLSEFNWTDKIISSSNILSEIDVYADSSDSLHSENSSPVTPNEEIYNLNNLAILEPAGGSTGLPTGLVSYEEILNVNGGHSIQTEGMVNENEKNLNKTGGIFNKTGGIFHETQGISSDVGGNFDEKGGILVQIEGIMTENEVNLTVGNEASEQNGDQGNDYIIEVSNILSNPIPIPSTDKPALATPYTHLFQDLVETVDRYEIDSMSGYNQTDSKQENDGHASDDRKDNVTTNNNSPLGTEDSNDRPINDLFSGDLFTTGVFTGDESLTNKPTIFFSTGDGVVTKNPAGDLFAQHVIPNKDSSGDESLTIKSTSSDLLPGTEVIKDDVLTNNPASDLFSGDLFSSDLFAGDLFSEEDSLYNESVSDLLEEIAIDAQSGDNASPIKPSVEESQSDELTNFFNSESNDNTFTSAKPETFSTPEKLFTNSVPVRSPESSSVTGLDSTRISFPSSFTTDDDNSVVSSVANQCPGQYVYLCSRN